MKRREKVALRDLEAALKRERERSPFGQPQQQQNPFGHVPEPFHMASDMSFSDKIKPVARESSQLMLIYTSPKVSKLTRMISLPLRL
mgnify:CR=1 FL=1